MRNRLLFVCFAVLAATLVFGTGDSQARKGPAQAFKEMDVDGDQQLSQTEFVDHCKSQGKTEEDCAERFKLWDKDASGSISTEEYKARLKEVMEERGGAAGRPRPAQTFNEIDTNQDRQLSKDEFLAHCATQGHPEDKCQESFGKWDADGNGSVSSEEYAAHVRTMVQERKGAAQ